MAMFDVSGCEPMKIGQIAAQGFLQPISQDAEPLLCLPDGDALSAIFLAGDWVYHSAPVSTLSNREGLFIPNVSIRADLDSLVKDDGVMGAIVRSQGVYGIRTYRKANGDGFTQRVIVPIDGVSPQFTPEAVRVAFTKWEIGMQVETDWFRLSAVDVTPSPQGRT